MGKSREGRSEYMKRYYALNKARLKAKKDRVKANGGVKGPDDHFDLDTRFLDHLIDGPAMRYGSHMTINEIESRACQDWTSDGAINEARIWREVHNHGNI